MYVYEEVEVNWTYCNHFTIYVYRHDGVFKNCQKNGIVGYIEPLQNGIRVVESLKVGFFPSVQIW